MVRPIDLQDSLSKTQAVLKVTEAQRANPDNEQRTAMIISDQKHRDDQKKPQPTEHSDEVILHKDRQEQKGNKDKETDGTDGDIGDPGSEAEEQRSIARHDDEEQLPPPALDITV